MSPATTARAPGGVRSAPRLVPDLLEDLSLIAQRTTGMTGADLANLLNTAAIRSTVDELSAVPMAYLEEAFDRVKVGAPRRNLKNLLGLVRGQNSETPTFGPFGPPGPPEMAPDPPENM